MKLNTLLDKLVADEKLSADERSQISTAIDAIKAKAVSELEAQVKTLTDELTPYKTAKRDSHISELVKELLAKDKMSDGIKLAGIKDEDTDEVIIEKINKTIETREWLKPGPVTDPTAVVENKQEVKPKVEAPKAVSKTVNGVAL